MHAEQFLQPSRVLETEIAIIRVRSGETLMRSLQLWRGEMYVDLSRVSPRTNSCFQPIYKVWKVQKKKAQPSLILTLYTV